jgi:hypothetical protein
LELSQRLREARSDRAHVAIHRLACIVKQLDESWREKDDVNGGARPTIKRIGRELRKHSDNSARVLLKRELLRVLAVHKMVDFPLAFFSEQTRRCFFAR